MKGAVVAIGLVTRFVGGLLSATLFKAKEMGEERTKVSLERMGGCREDAREQPGQEDLAITLSTAVT